MDPNRENVGEGGEGYVRLLIKNSDINSVKSEESTLPGSYRVSN